MVQLSNGPTNPQPAHIHKGSCANLDPVPAYPLNNVVNGMSDTTVPAAIADLAKGGYALNVHKSAQEVATYVSCGDIMATNTNPNTPGQPGSPPGGVPLPTQSITVQINAQNGSGENGTATITVSGQDQVTVVLNLSNGTSTPQPAHIHKGTCANLDPVPAYPLTNVVNGQSQTTVKAGLGDLMTQGYAINVHKSATEITTYVSCGDITAQAVPGGTTGGTGGQTGGTGGQTGGTPGMPTTGNGDQTNLLLALTLLALLIMGAGLTLVRRRA
jgi:LPXTG-motif cell wall-anchored protein